ncbi:MAG: PqqD family protein [Xanthobacteraceae bacterium]
MDISLTDSVVRRADVLSTVVDDCVVLLDSDRQVFVGFDDIGTYIWQAAEKPIVVADLCAALAARYAAERPVIEGDVVQFLDQLLQQKLVERTT